MENLDTFRYTVICKVGLGENTTSDHAYFERATSKSWLLVEDALEWMKTIHPAREPKVVMEHTVGQICKEENQRLQA